jgi:hypothetical protein
MTDFQKMAQASTDAVRRLRLQKLKSGHPFMINSRDLPSGECYLEYPDGAIKLVAISDNGRNFILIRELSSAEIQKLRKKFHLSID